MIVREFYSTRKDGVNLYRSIDAKVDENGEPLRDEYNQLIPTGLKIRKVGTDEIYDEAIDVEGSGYTYTETDKPIEVDAFDLEEFGREYTETDVQIEEM